MAIKDKTKDFYMSVMSYFREKQAELISRYVIAARKQEMNVFDKLKTIQFASVVREDNKLLNEFITKTGVNNPKAIVYLTVENKYVVVNNMDDLKDTVDDIIDGSSTSMKNLQDITGNELPFNLLFTPDDMTFFNLSFKHFMSFFDGFKYFVMYGVTLFLVEKYAKISYMHGGIALTSLVLVFSMLMSYKEGSDNGVF